MLLVKIAMTGAVILNLMQIWQHNIQNKKKSEIIIALPIVKYNINNKGNGNV